MRLFSNFLNKTLSSIVSVAMVATSFPLAVPLATAAPVCTNAYSADAGQVAGCAGVRIGGTPVSFAKLQWQSVSQMPMLSSPGSTTVVGGNEAIQLANRSAAALGLNASDVASVVTLFPANVPYVFARYNPLDQTLRIDIFKLEKTVTANTPTAGLYRATFTPANGDFWKASRSYIHPDAYKAGNTPGVNPFAYFVGSDEYFHNIGLGGARVAIGHAMRYAGAPFAVLQVAETRMGTETRKSGNAFRKKVTTIVNGFAKPHWFIAQPASFMQRSTTLPMDTFCAPDPTRESCAAYETATSGVSFEEFDGGMLSNAEDKWELDRQTKSGWGFLALLVILPVASFALVAIAPALGLAAGAAAGAGAIGPAAGLFGNLLVSGGLLTGITSTAAMAAIETVAYASGLALLGGANMGGMYTFKPNLLTGISAVPKATGGEIDNSAMTRKLSLQVQPRTTSDFAQGGATLTGFQTTVIGGCAVGTKLSACAAASTGVVQRLDQYKEHNMVEFIRDNSGTLVRDATKP